MTIHRQNDKTEIYELVGKECQKLLIVAQNINSSLNIAYMMIGDIWHRFFIDVKVLFWQEGLKPDMRDDLGDGEEYIELINQLKIENTRIKSIIMENGQLSITFNDNRSIIFIEEDEETYWREV